MKRYVLGCYAIWVAFLITAYYGLPGLRLETWSLISLSGVIAIGLMILVIFLAEKFLPPMQALRDYALLGGMFATIFVLGIGISFISTHRSVLKYLDRKSVV